MLAEVGSTNFDKKAAEGYDNEYARVTEVLDHILLGPHTLTDDAQATLAEIADAHATLQLHSSSHDAALASVEELKTHLAQRTQHSLQLKLATLRLKALSKELRTAVGEGRELRGQLLELSQQQEQHRARVQQGPTSQIQQYQNDRLKSELEAAGFNRDVNVEKAVQAQKYYDRILGELAGVREQLAVFADAPEDIGEATRKLQALRQEYDCMQVDWQKAVEFDPTRG